MNFATPNAAQNIFYYRNGPNAKHSAELPASLLESWVGDRQEQGDGGSGLFLQIW